MSCAFSGQFASASDEPADPISKLGQRSALQRWKDARLEWVGPMGRRDRRQQLRHGAAIDGSFAPDAAAPQVTLPAEPVPVFTEEPPARVDLTPVLMEPDAPMFIAPPRTAPALPPPALPAPVPSPVDVQLTPAVPDARESEPKPFPAEVRDMAMDDHDATDQMAPAEPRQPLPTASEAAERDPAALIRQAPVETAFLPQLPRPPVGTPTPAPPPTRLPPPAPPRLPPESPRFEVPRSEPLMPPAPEDVPRTAGPVELPQLKKITTIQPFRSCSTDGSGVKMCPPNTAGDGSDSCPEQQPLPVFDGAERNFIDIAYCWDAPNLFHTPLYFEDVGLERYGHTYCEPIQSIASVAKFGTQLAGLPYQMALAPVHKKEYPLGYYRPGDPAPYKCYQVPLNAEAAFKAAYVYSGLSVIVP